MAREEAIATQHMEANHYNEYEHEETEVDDFEKFESRREKFLETLKNPAVEQTRENSFYSVLLFAIKFNKTEDSDFCEEEELKEKIGENLYIKLESKRDMCPLNLNKKDFDYMCFDINEILIKENMFLRVYELKDKFRYLFNDNNKKKNVIRRVSACIKEKFNGFHIALPSLAKGQKKDLVPVNIIYKPVRSREEIIECFFSENDGDDLKYSMPHECYYCSSFFAWQRDFDKHIKICSGKPGVVYDFNLQNVVTFEDNIKYKGDIPLCVYADFKTTAPTNDCLNPENKTMFAVSYALVFAWHPKLNLERQVVVRGYNHSLSELGDISYLTTEKLAMRNKKTAEQLRDAVMNVHSKKNKKAIAEMFNIKLKIYM